MAKRHEEKYLIDYRQYAVLKAKAMQVLQPDTNGEWGSYLITSLYYDDIMDTALLEKQDGLPCHTKFRVRTYDCKNDFIRLERKVKEGQITQKESARILLQDIPSLGQPDCDLELFEGKAYDLAAKMQAVGMRPSINVRYRRDAFLFPGSDLRLTFDTNLEAIAPDVESLFDPDCAGIPVLDGNTVIMEIKYGRYLPNFIRKLTTVPCQQLSVSKYALCREIMR